MTTELPQPKRESLFLRIADWVSEAMGKPANILFWVVLVVAWTVIFAAHIVPASGSFLPDWFTGQGYNFPLNLLTTVAELFIGFLVAAAANRSERILLQTLAQIEAQEERLSAAIDANTELTQAVHDLTAQIHALMTQQSGKNGT